MAEREPVEIMDLLTLEEYTHLEDVIEQDNIDVFKIIFESEEQPLHPEDTLWDYPLLFIAAGCRKHNHYYSPQIVEYLVEKGADVNRMAIRGKAEEYSTAYRRFVDPDDNIDEIDHVHTSILMNLAMEGNINAMNYFYNHGADLYQETTDEWDGSIQGETALVLAERKLIDMDEAIHWGVTDNFWMRGTPNYLTKERIKVARAIKWLRWISVDENIPKVQASWQNRARLRQVLRGAPHTGRLETDYMMSFLPKPAKFQKPSNINLRKINTTLFQGGRTRKQKQRKQRKTRCCR